MSWNRKNEPPKEITGPTVALIRQNKKRVLNETFKKIYEIKLNLILESVPITHTSSMLDSIE